MEQLFRDSGLGIPQVVDQFAVCTAGPGRGDGASASRGQGCPLSSEVDDGAATNPMREIRDVLWLARAGGLSERRIAASVRIAPSTVHRYLDRAARAGLGWPLPTDLDDAALERARCSRRRRRRRCRAPHRITGWIHRELRRKGVTLQLLWMEYRQAHPRRLRLLPVLRAFPAVGRAGALS